jgi:phage gp46-like protein
MEKRARARAGLDHTRKLGWWAPEIASSVGVRLWTTRKGFHSGIAPFASVYFDKVNSSL